MNIDEELLLDAQEDAQLVAYIQEHLPADVVARFSEDDLYYILDVAEEYFAESGVLDAEADDEGYVNIDLEAVAEHIAAKARKEYNAEFAIDDLELIVEAQLNFGEEQ